MTPAELSRTVLRSVRGAVEERELCVTVPARIVVQPPPRPGCGDYASNVALQLAKDAGRPPREVAEILRRRLTGQDGIARVEIAGPGFLNFTLAGSAQSGLLRTVLEQGAAYGRGERAGTAAPVALRPAPGVRAAVVAEALERVLEAAGLGTAPGGEDVRPLPVSGSGAELLARLGADEMRWALLRPAAHDRVRLPERPVQHESNPRFRVQYAHARTRALLRNAHDLGFAPEPGDPTAAPADGLPATASRPEPCADLQAALAAYPAAVEAAARHRAPDRIARHLESTADAFFRAHDTCPPLPVGEQKPLAVHRARLALAEATGTVLANGLRLLGISTPDRL